MQKWNNQTGDESSFSPPVLFGSRSRPSEHGDGSRFPPTSWPDSENRPHVHLQFAWLSHQLAVQHMKDSVGMLQHVLVVGDHDECLTILFIQALEEIHNAIARV
jgi:hypothetical protein